MKPWHEQKIWVTGASSGIGESLAIALSLRGAQLVLLSRRREALAKVISRCAKPERHAVVAMDLAQVDSIANIVAGAVAEHGLPDLVIHNGGISQRSTAVETEMGVYRELMEVNFFGTIGLTKALLPAMLERGSGHFAVVSSLVGKFGTPLRSGYAASKHALHGFFESLRAEVYERGIGVTMICPGFVRTQVSVNALSGDGSKHGRMDSSQEEGISSQQCARKILRALEKEAEEASMGGRERYMLLVKRFFPRTFSRIIRKVATT